MNLKKLRRKNSVIVWVLILVAAVVFVKRPDVFSPGETVSVPTSQEQATRVTRVTDGDTLVLADDTKVRLLGIDAPERGEPFYDEAKKYLSALVLGKDVRLARDVRDTDKYGRALRHIYVNDTWINEKMIRDGFARVVTFPPDVAHVERFTQAQDEAEREKRGMWQSNQ